MRPAARLLLVSVLVLAACAAPRPYRAEAGTPDVRRFDPGALALDLAVTVHGGDTSARVRGIDWEVLLDGLPIGVGTTGVEEVVPPRGRALLRLPLVVRTGAELPAGVRPALARGGSVPVVVRGTVRVRDREGDTVRLPFSAATRARLAGGAGPAPAYGDDEGP